MLVDVTGKSLENLKIALKSDGSSEQAKIISIKTYTADVMKELCQSQETNADFVKKNVWIPYSFEGTIRAIFVKSYNVEDIISSVSAQVGTCS